MNKASIMAASERQVYFYSPEGVAFIKHGGIGYSLLLRAAGQVLAQRGGGQVGICVTDRQGSVLRLVGRDTHWVMAYTPYGHDSGEGSASLLQFNGQREEAVTEHYLLGNGYRPFSSSLMRFIVPDNLSPFEAGGLNAYGYCGGDPINWVDPSGHHPQPPNSFLTGGVFTKRWWLRAAVAYKATPKLKAPALKTLGVKQALSERDPTLKSRVRNAQKNHSWRQQDVDRLKNASVFLTGIKNRFELAERYFSNKYPIEAKAAAETRQEVSRVLGWVHRKLEIGRAAQAVQPGSPANLVIDVAGLNSNIRTDG